MMKRTTALKNILILLWLVAINLAAFGQSTQVQTSAENKQPAQNTATAAPAAREINPRLSAYLGANTVINKKASRQYQLVWGIDDILVKQVASGALIRFSYRVLDPAKAKILNDEKLTPQLVDEASHMALRIPEMEQVGKLRQTATPEAGREYWMVFSNKGGYVRPGNRVAIVIGDFRINGLIVQ